MINKFELKASGDKEHLQEPEVRERTWDRTSWHEDVQQDRLKDLMMDRMDLKHTNRLLERLKDRKEYGNLQTATINIIVTATSQCLRRTLWTIYTFWSKSVAHFYNLSWKLNHQAWICPTGAGSRPKITKIGKTIFSFTCQCGSQALSKRELNQSSLNLGDWINGWSVVKNNEGSVVVHCSFPATVLCCHTQTYNKM